MPETDPATTDPGPTDPATTSSLLPRTRTPPERIEIVYSETPVAGIPHQHVRQAVALSDLEDVTAAPGDTVVASAKVGNLSENETRVVLQAQGLPASWRPVAQVIQLPAHNAARVFLYLTPPPGTAPGRYQWALTAETGHAPLQAISAQLIVTRPPPTPDLPPSRTPSRRWARLAAVVIVLAVLALTGFLLHRPGPPPVPMAPGEVDDLGERGSELQARDESEPITIRGKVFVVGARPDEPVRASVRKVGLDDLTGSSKARRPLRRQLEIAGNDWSVRLRPGLYTATFVKPGCAPQSVLIDNLGPGLAAPPSVQLCAEA